MKAVLYRSGWAIATGFACFAVLTSGFAAEEKRTHIALSTNLGHDFSDAFALAYLIAHPHFELSFVTPAGTHDHGSARILKRLFWLVGAEEPVFHMASAGPGPAPPVSSGMFQFGLRPVGKFSTQSDSSEGGLIAATFINLSKKTSADAPRLSEDSLEKLFSTGTPLAHALWSLHELADREAPSLDGARKIAAVAGEELTEERFIELVGACKGQNEVPDRVLKPVRNVSQPVESGGFPNRVHVIENYQTDIESPWWLSGELIQSYNVNRYCRGMLTRNFDGKMGDPTRIYRAVIFNPVPGPPMGANTRLKFRYRIEGADWLQCQIFSLSKGYHRYTTIENLPQGEWQTAVVDMTKARRPDGSGGPLSADERIDDLQFYTDPNAELLIDDMILYDAATGETDRSFPADVIFTGWFDTGKQGKEWPGDFEIVPREKPHGWDAARSVIDPEAGEPWIRVGLRGPRPAGGGFRVRFDYRLVGNGPIRVMGVNSTYPDAGALPLQEETNVDQPVAGAWATAEVVLHWPLDAMAGWRQKPLPAEHLDEIRFRVPKGSRLEIDNLLIYRQNWFPSMGSDRQGGSR